MAFTEFDGELDDEAGFKPFDGELDAPAATAKAEPGLADRYRGVAAARTVELSPN